MREKALIKPMSLDDIKKTVQNAFQENQGLEFVKKGQPDWQRRTLVDVTDDYCVLGVNFHTTRFSVLLFDAIHSAKECDYQKEEMKSNKERYQAKKEENENLLLQPLAIERAKLFVYRELAGAKEKMAEHKRLAKLRGTLSTCLEMMLLCAEIFSEDQKKKFLEFHQGIQELVKDVDLIAALANLLPQLAKALDEKSEEKKEA